MLTAHGTRAGMAGSLLRSEARIHRSSLVPVLVLPPPKVPSRQACGGWVLRVCESRVSVLTAAFSRQNFIAKAEWALGRLIRFGKCSAKGTKKAAESLKNGYQGPSRTGGSPEPRPTLSVCSHRESTYPPASPRFTHLHFQHIGLLVSHRIVLPFPRVLQMQKKPRRHTRRHPA